MIKKKRKDKIRRINILLVLLIAVLTVLIYRNVSRPSELSVKDTNVYIYELDSPPGRPRVSRPITRKVNYAEQQLLTFSRNALSHERKKDFIKLIQDEAKESENIDIRTCDYAAPLVLKLKYNQDFNFTNSDKVKHIIKVDTQNTYDLRAGESKKIKAKFGKGRGIYGYICDNLNGPVGFLYVQ